MKRMFFSLILLLGTVVALAEEKTDSVNEALYGQAVKALEGREFIVRFNTEDYKGQRRKTLNNETNFLILEGESVTYQYDDGRREYLWNDIIDYRIPEMEKGKATDIKVEKKNDDYVLVMSVDVKGKRGTGSRFKMKITLKDQTYNCAVVKSASWGNTYYTGTLYPIGGTTVMKAN